MTNIAFSTHLLRDEESATCSDSENAEPSEALVSHSDEIPQELDRRNSHSWIFRKAPFACTRLNKQMPRDNLDVKIESTSANGSISWRGHCRFQGNSDHKGPNTKSISRVLREESMNCSDFENCEKSNGDSEELKDVLDGEDVQELERKNSESWIFRKAPFACIRSIKQRRKNLDVKIMECSSGSSSPKVELDHGEETIKGLSTPRRVRVFDNSDKVLNNTRSRYIRDLSYDLKSRASCMTYESAQITATQLHEQLQETKKIIAAQQSEIDYQWTIIQQLQAQHKRMLACQIDMEETLRCMNMPQFLSSVALSGSP